MNVDDPRFAVAAARRMLHRAGCESLVAGHVSQRDKGGETFWVTPFQYFDETLPDDVIEIGITDLRLRGEGADASPAVEFHSKLYQARPDVNAVVHLHSHWVSVWAATGRPVGTHTPPAALFYEEQAFFADDGTRPGAEGDRIVASIGDRNVLWMANHGVIVVAPDLGSATVQAMMLERVISQQIPIEAIGGHEPPEAEVRRVKGQYHKYFIPNMWEANLRRLRRSDPELFA
jgi:L-fuculose-phosphate aldolase